MTSVTGSFSSSVPRRSEGGSGGVDDGSHTPAPPPRSRAGSAQPPMSAATGDGGGVLFYSAARRRLAGADEGSHAAPPYGTAARRLRDRERPGASGYGKIVEFELDVPAAVHSTIAAMRQRGYGRPQHRPGGAPRSAYARLLARMEAATPREPDGTGVVVKSEYITQLEAQLGTCGAAGSPRARRSHDSVAPRHGASSPKSVSMTALHRVDSRSHARPRPRESAEETPPLRVAELTKAWVQREEEERAGAGPDFFPTSLPLAETPRPARAVHSPERPTVARLRAGKFRPYSAPQPPPAAASRAPVEGDAADAGTAQPPWRRRLLTEPIQSYRVLHDASKVPVPTTPSARIPMLGSGRLRRRNVEELRHGFEYERFRMHGELEDRLEWRQRCRTAVLRRTSATGSEGDPTLSLPPSESAASAAASVLLDSVFGGGSEKARGHLRRTNPIGPSATSFRSAWAQEAARQAVRQEKARLVALLRAFVVTCSAAALTLAATEELRAETIQRVWHPKSDRGSRRCVFFLRDHFLDFLQERYQLQFTVLLDASETLRPTDIIDTLPSQAEASFAAYAYEILPAHTSSEG